MWDQCDPPFKSKKKLEKHTRKKHNDLQKPELLRSARGGVRGGGNTYLRLLKKRAFYYSCEPKELDSPLPTDKGIGGKKTGGQNDRSPGED